MPGYYAVAHGRSEGIYRTWAETEPLVMGFSGAKQEFQTLHEAEAYLAEHGSSADVQAQQPPQSSSSPSSSPSSASALSSSSTKSDSDIDEVTQKLGSLSTESKCKMSEESQDSVFVAFCSGSAQKNGQEGGQAAFACVFLDGANPKWYVACRLDGPSKSNRAVYCAALYAVRRANRLDSEQSRELVIHTNNKDLVDSMTVWIKRWRNNGWKTSSRKPVKNRDVLEAIGNEQGERKIQWCYKKEHVLINRAHNHAVAAALDPAVAVVSIP